MRVIYIGIRPTVFIGAQVFAGDTIAKSNDRDPWYMRIRDTVHNIWIDPLRIFPQILEEKRILMRLIDFEFAYESQERTKQQDVRVIQRIMPSGRFRAIVMATLRDIHSEKFLLPVHIVVRIGSHHFTFTQEELFAYAQQDDDVVTIEDNQVRLFLPELTLSRDIILPQYQYMVRLAHIRLFHLVFLRAKGGCNAASLNTINILSMEL